MSFAKCLSFCPGLVLTHWGQDNVAIILQMSFSNLFSYMQTSEFQIKFKWNIFHLVFLPIYQHLVQIMFCRWTSDKPLSHPITTQFTDPYMLHASSVSFLSRIHWSIPWLFVWSVTLIWYFLYSLRPSDSYMITLYASVNWAIIGSDNGLLPTQRQAIIWTNAGILLIGTLGTNVSEILIAIHTFLFKKMRFKISSAKWQPFCLGLNVFTHWGRVTHTCVSKLTIIGSNNGLSVPSHYLNQCWNIVNSTLRNKLQWNLKGVIYIFIQENPFENVVWKMAAILFWPQCKHQSVPSLVSLLPVSCVCLPWKAHWSLCKQEGTACLLSSHQSNFMAHSCWSHLQWFLPGKYFQLSSNVVHTLTQGWF